MTRTSVLAKTIVCVVLVELAFLTAPPANGNSSGIPLDPFFSVLVDHTAIDADSRTVLSFRNHCFLVGGLNNDLSVLTSSATSCTEQRIGDPVHPIQECGSAVDFFPAIDQIAAEMKRLAEQYDALGTNRTIQVQDPYWKYYDDCDRWNVVFTTMEYWANRSNEPTNCVGAPLHNPEDARSAEPVAKFDEVDRLLLQAKLDYELLSRMQGDFDAAVAPAKSNLLNASFRRRSEHDSQEIRDVAGNVTQPNRGAALQIASGISDALQFTAETMTGICRAVSGWVQSAEFVLVESDFLSYSMPASPARTSEQLEKASPWPAISRAAVKGIVRCSIWTRPLVWGGEKQILWSHRPGNSLLIEPVLDWSFNVGVQYRQMRKLESNRISRWIHEIASRAKWITFCVQNWSNSMARAIDQQTHSFAR